MRALLFFILLAGIDLEVDQEEVLAVEGANGFGGALFAVALGPDLVVDVLGELAEAVGSFVICDVALDGQRAGVFEVDDCAPEGSVILIHYLTLDDTLHWAALLRQYRGQVCRNHHGGEAARENQK